MQPLLGKGQQVSMACIAVFRIAWDDVGIWIVSILLQFSMVWDTKALYVLNNFKLLVSFGVLVFGYEEKNLFLPRNEVNSPLSNNEWPAVFTKVNQKTCNSMPFGETFARRKLLTNRKFSIHPSKSVIQLAEMEQLFHCLHYFSFVPSLSRPPAKFS